MNLKIPAKYLLAILVSIIAATIFYELVFVFNIRTDIQDHIAVLQTNLEKGGFRINFLYFVLIWIFSGFSSSVAPLLWASIFILSAAVGAKFLISWNYFEINKKVSISMLLIFSCIGLIFCTNIFFQQHWGVWFKIVGNLPANVWHNSTVILLMPFSLMLFSRIERFLNKPEKEKLWPICLLIFLNITIKPNYIFTLVPSLGLFFLLYKSNYKHFKKFALIIGVALSFIALQYILNFIVEVNAVNGGENKIAIKPFHVWHHYSKNVPLSLIYSLFFPIVAATLLFEKLKTDRIFWFLILNLTIGIIISIIMTEGGAYEFDNNFSWQNVVNVYILFMYLLAQWIKADLNWKKAVSFLAFSAHVVFGLYYIYKMFIDGFYL